jgi:AraC family transcriptional regulator
MKEQLLAVQRMQDYIEAHIDEAVTMTDLARASMFSPWHSYRLFRSYMGLTPAEYIRRLKLLRAAAMLKSGEHKVVDVANEFGFGSADSFQRAFKRHFGYNPSDYIRRNVPTPFFPPYGVKFRENRKENATMENIRNIFIQIIDKPARKAIIRRGVKAREYFEYCEEVGCDLWDELTKMDCLGNEPVCLWLPDAYKTPGTSTYVQGVEVAADYNGSVPQDFDVISLPPAQYLMFQGEPFREEDYSQAISEVWQAMDKYDPTVIGYEWDDENPRIQLAPVGERGYIELRAVKKISAR